MIDPLESIIQYLLLQTNLTDIVGTRISVRHKYGDSWTLEQNGLAVTMNGGPSDIYIPLQNINMQFRIYGTKIEDGMAIYKELVKIMRNAERKTVSVTDGTALILWINQTSAPALVTDYDLDKNILLVNFNTAVGENAI